MPRSIPTSSILTAAMLLVCAAGSAFAQNALGDGQALGDGRSLDANPGQYGTSNYQRPSLMDELKFRNAIVTGNAPGGLSFRGDLGYRAPGEFSGELGSDSLFAFRRDSFYSGLAGMGIRGTDALQYQFALTTGSNPPRNLMGSLSYSRNDMFSSSSSYSGHAGTTNPRFAPTGGTLSIDQTASSLDTRGKMLSASQNLPGLEDGSMLGTLRSSSTYTTTSSLQPSLMSVYTEGVDRRPMGLISSPLLGITATPLTQEPKAANPLVARPPNADLDPSVPGDLPSTRIKTSYDDLVQEMRERVQAMREEQQGDGSASTVPGESNDQWLIRQMQDLREKLYGTKPANDDASGTDPNNPGSNMGQNPGDGQSEGADGQRDPGSGAESADPTKAAIPPAVSVPSNDGSPLREVIDNSTKSMSKNDQGVPLYDPTEIAIDPDTLEVLRGSASKEVEQLFDPRADTRNIYAEHMSAGQELIQAGRYFDAEERFTHALSIKSGDVSAQMGRLHAQIGAGMLLSASVNLQSLFTTHPELITTRYSGNLLPNAERITSLKARLRERAGLIRYEHSSPRATEGDRVRVSAGLLLAYLGYQTEDQSALDQGLGVVRVLGTDSDRRFASLLAQLWDAHPITDITPTPAQGSTPSQD